MSGLKPTTGKVSKSGKTASKGQGKSGAGKDGKSGGEISSKRHNQILSVVDQSPYLHFGVPGVASGLDRRGSNVNGGKSKGTGNKRNAVEKGNHHNILLESKKDVPVTTTAATKPSAAARNNGKDVISTVINQNVKAFSERESNVSARYRFHTFQNSAAMTKTGLN